MAKFFFALLVIAAVCSIGDAASIKADPENIAGLILFRRNASNPINEYLLLEKVEEPGDWSPPKGHMDLGETAEEGAIRELFEETGFLPADVEIFTQFYEYFEYTTGAGIDKRVRLWPARLLDESKEVIKSEEHLQTVWGDATIAGALIKKNYRPAFQSAVANLNAYYSSL